MLKGKIKKNWLFITSIIVIYSIFTIPLPFYIEKDGGLISTKDRIKIQNNVESSGNIYMAYVSEIKGTIPNYIISLFNKNWNVISKKDIVSSNETEQEAEYRSKMMLNESITNAVISAYTLANKKIDIIKEECFVTYIDSSSNTNLKIKDKILKINGNDINTKDDITKNIKNLKENDIVNIEVENNNKIYTRTAKINNDLVIGIIVTTTKILKTTPNYEVNFKKSESGSSGGLMLALEIYNNLIDDDITKNRKIAGTGTIDENGNVGSISGVKYKLMGAYNEKADVFLVPHGENYNEAIKVANDNHLNIKIIEISSLSEAILKLKED